MIEKIHLDYAEFYITNVCNLTCTHCNRYNNYNFKGWQSWKEYSEVYRRWAKKVDIEHIAILGGEPLLNPEILEWCAGLYEAFRPQGGPGIDVVTNGYRINKVKGLYETVKSGRVFLTVTLHNPNEKEFVFQELRKFIGPGPEIKETESASSCFIEDAGLKIFVNAAYEFTTSAVITKDNRLTLHNSDPVLAHSVCGFAQCKCYHFIKGKFYKCGPVALLPEFDQQFKLDISEDRRELLTSYQPLTINEFDQRAQEFFSKLDEPIPQCSFCPEAMEWRPLLALPKSQRTIC